ncbi:MAG: ATPase, partial [Pseudomonadota bacterium]
YGAIGFALFFLLFWVRAISQNKLARKLAETGRALSSVLDDLEPVEALQAAAVIQEEDREEGADEEAAIAAEEQPAEPTAQIIDRAARERLSQRVADFQADFAEVREGVGMQQNLLRGAMDASRERGGQLDEAISQEQARIARVEGLRGMQDDLEKKHVERQHHLDQCDLAGELIQGAMREVSYQFNHKVRDLVSKTLPLFTEHRYEHLQIDDDLTVRAFSSEKRDFMDLEEISSGTQRQIMLAVRLALSQELVGRAVKASQFLFLDEPFAFFDQARTRSSLTVLPSLSEQLNQIWIIGQEFPLDLKFDHHITCNREYQTIPPVEPGLKSDR